LDVNVTADANGWNSLMFLTRNFRQSGQFVGIVQVLIELGLNINARDKDGWNVLHFLCKSHGRKNLYEIIHSLLEETDIDPSAMESVTEKKPVDFLLALPPKTIRRNKLDSVIHLLSR
jgi:ankyrin repeat protein